MIMPVSFCKMNKLILTLSLFLPLSSFANSACSRLDNDVKIISWAYEVMLRTYNFNFINYSNDKAQAYFTKPAWLRYKKEFNLVEYTKEVVSKKLVSSVGLRDAPIFLKMSPNSWTLSLPLIVNYRNAAVHKIKNINVKMIIVRDFKSHDCLKVTAIHKMPVANVKH